MVLRWTKHRKQLVSWLVVTVPCAILWCWLLAFEIVPSALGSLLIALVVHRVIVLIARVDAFLQRLWALFGSTRGSSFYVPERDSILDHGMLRPYTIEDRHERSSAIASSLRESFANSIVDLTEVRRAVKARKDERQRKN